MSKPQSRDKQAKSFRLTKEARDLLELMADREGHTETAVIESAIRDLARKREVALTEKEKLVEPDRPSGTFVAKFKDEGRDKPSPTLVERKDQNG